MPSKLYNLGVSLLKRTIINIMKLNATIKSEKAVSEVMGMVMVLSIMVVVIGSIMVVGIPMIQSSKDRGKMDVAANTFLSLQNDIEEVVKGPIWVNDPNNITLINGTGPSRETEFELMEGTLSVYPNSSGITYQIASYTTHPSVEHAAPSIRLTTANIPNDPAYAQQWSLQKIAWAQAYEYISINGSAKIAVLDTGVDATHPDLAGRMIAGKSFVNGDPYTDPNGHGTALAGIAAAEVNNSVGIAGISYANTGIMSVQVLQANGTGYDRDVVSGVLWAVDHGANVILMGFSSPDYSTSLNDAITYAWKKGVVVVAATGNGGSTAPSYPAGMANVIGVAATDENDNLVSSSNTGSASVAAPGVNIYTTLPGGGYGSVGGTSAASAHVAGLAVLLAANGGSNGNIYNQIRSATDTIAGMSFGKINVAMALGEQIATLPASAVTAMPIMGTAPKYIIATANPTITNIYPNNKNVGAAGFNMTVTGTNFDSTSVVQFAGSNRTTAFVNSTTLTASILTSDLITAGNFGITVLRVSDNKATSSLTFTVNNPVPKTNYILPSSANAGDPGFILIVNGTNFTSTSVVWFNGLNRVTTYISSTQLNASILSSDIATAGIFNITVSNPSPGGGISNNQTFTVNPAPSPTPPAPSGSYTINISSGNITYASGQESIVYENGAVIRKYESGDPLMISDPLISIYNTLDNTTNASASNITVSIHSININGTSSSVGGDGKAWVETTLERYNQTVEPNSSSPNTNQVNIRIYSNYPDAWSAFFDKKLSGAGLVSSLKGSNTGYNISGTMPLEVQIYGNAQSISQPDIFLSVYESKINLKVR